MSPIDALRTALCQWDPAGMGAAARAMIEHALGHALAGADAIEVEWVFRELMEAAEGHPAYSTSFEVEDVRFSLGISAQSTSGRIAALALDFTVSPGQDPAATARWKEAFGRVNVVVSRTDVAAPRPLKGEPGYDPESCPSIHRDPGAKPTAATQTWAAGRALAAGSGPWLRRYRAGEHAAVWNELIALGDGVRAPEVFGDAVDVALETMRRARVAIEALRDRLRDQGYAFVRAAEAYEPPCDDVEGRIAAIESTVGPIPLAFCAFASVVGSVDLCGEHPAWASPGEGILDPLVVAPANWVLSDDDRSWYRHVFRLVFSPDSYHKEDISGGPPYELRAPCGHADAIVEFERTRPTFVELLRRSLAFGGFPGWSEVDAAKRPAELLAALVHGLPAI
jgi:hypothetical protein